jgi:hypothetical protein
MRLEAQASQPCVCDQRVGPAFSTRFRHNLPAVSRPETDDRWPWRRRTGDATLREEPDSVAIPPAAISVRSPECRSAVRRVGPVERITRIAVRTPHPATPSARRVGAAFRTMADMSGLLALANDRGFIRHCVLCANTKRGESSRDGRRENDFAHDAHLSFRRDHTPPVHVIWPSQKRKRAIMRRKPTTPWLSCQVRVRQRLGILHCSPWRIGLRSLRP